MLNKLRSFSNTKLAGVLIAIIIIPFVFWGMGSVFSGGNTNNVAKINNETISAQDLINHIKLSRLDLDQIKKNIDNNAIENILSTIVSKKLLEMEIQNLDISVSEKTLVNRIKSDEVFLDDDKNFSRIKYEKFLLENNLTAPDFEIKLQNQILRKNLFSYIGGGIKSPNFLLNKIYISETKELEIDYFNLDIVYDTETSDQEIDDFIKENEENLKDELIDFSFAKITPTNLIQINEFNNEFFKKIDEIENGILNGLNIDEIQKKYDLKINTYKNYKNNSEKDEILSEIYSKKNGDKIQLIDKNDYYLLFEITKINKVLPNKSDLNFIEKVKKNLLLKKKYEYNKDLFQKIQDKKLNNNEFIKIANDIKNINTVTIKSINDDKIFDKDSIKLIYSLPKNSFVLLTDINDKIYLANIKNILTSNISSDNSVDKIYLSKSNRKILDEIYSSYDLSLNKKYKVKIFQNTIDRIKNNFK
tara:strand:+ start:1162 stop:2583 length:1422 start_codon:yes stop_codon:yes gene_type:complete